jgi:membrane protease subunit HflK
VAQYQARESGETQRLFRPLVAVLEWIVARIGWIVAAVAVLYLVSGVTFVRANEVALVLRFGRLVGESPAEQVHGPGLLIALPFPIDRVERVPLELVREVRVEGLDATDAMRRSDPLGEIQGDRIDPLVEGYTITGDRFVMQTRLVARYRVGDPLAFALESSAAERERLVRDVVQAAAAEAITRYRSFELVSGLTALPIEVQTSAQVELDALGSGVELVEVLLTSMSYPRQVLPAVQDVIDARSQALTSVRVAEGRRDADLELVERTLAQFINGAHTYANDLVASTTGTLNAYEELVPQFRAAPRVVLGRLVMNGLGRIIRNSGARTVRFPPPADGVRYPELRISLPITRAPAASPEETEGDR